MVKKYTRVLFLQGLMILIGISYYPAAGQGFQSMKQAEDSLVALFITINQSPDDSIKKSRNALFSQCLYNALRLPDAGNHAFQSLKSLVIISSPDNKFTIYHWNLPDSRGNHTYFGFIKTINRDPAVIIPLKESTDSNDSPDTSIVNNSNWYGALYYKIIVNESNKGQKYYTLLGWSGKTATITQKIIEILTFDMQGTPKFGLHLFPDFKDGKMSRIIFRYSASTSMSLKYEAQSINSDKKWNSKKRVFDYTARDASLIVFDRLVPLDSQLEGQYQFYVAAGDVFDGFEFNNGCWNFVKDIDSRNKK